MPAAAARGSTPGGTRGYQLLAGEPRGDPVARCPSHLVDVHCVVVSPETLHSQQICVLGRRGRARLRSRTQATQRCPLIGGRGRRALCRGRIRDSVASVPSRRATGTHCAGGLRDSRASVPLRKEGHRNAFVPEGERLSQGSQRVFVCLCVCGQRLSVDFLACCAHIIF